jgi:hypothetical protein
VVFCFLPGWWRGVNFTFSGESNIYVNGYSVELIM